MKYTYGDIEKKDIIDNYQIEDNVITITYLDKHVTKYVYTKEKEQEIISKMVEQAVERTKHCDYKFMGKLDRRIFGIENSVIGLLGLICFYLLDIINKKEIPYDLYSVIMIILSIYLSGSVISYKNVYTKLEDDEKYRKWVENRDRDGICAINELDGTTLKEIKKQLKLE